MTRVTKTIPRGMVMRSKLHTTQVSNLGQTSDILEARSKIKFKHKPRIVVDSFPVNQVLMLSSLG